MFAYHIDRLNNILDELKELEQTEHRRHEWIAAQSDFFITCQEAGLDACTTNELLALGVVH